MATKPISSWVSDAILFVFRLCVFIVFGNPLSMFFINLLAPHCAAEFAKNQAYFGEKIYRFYEYLALKLPFHWAKWWMKLENIRKYTANQQIKYFLKVSFKNNTAVETLKAMMSAEGMTFNDACEKLFFKYGDKKLPVKELHSREEGGCVCAWRDNITVCIFMMRNVRLDYWSLQEVIKRAVHDENLREELKKYMASGRLMAQQLDLLLDAVATNSGEGHLQMLGILLDYVRRYGLLPQQTERIAKQYPQQFCELLAEADMYHTQVKTVKAFKNTDKWKSDWREFCKETPLILPEVQAMMNFDQYCIFHNVGRVLAAKAVEEFLHRPDEALWKAVFTKEPYHGLLDAQMHTLVVECENGWNKVYLSVFGKMFDELRQKVTAGQKLNEQEQVELFNMPDAAEVAPLYFEKYKLCDKAETYMVTRSCARLIFERYIDKYQLSAVARNQMFDAYFAPVLVRMYVLKYSLGKSDIRIFELKCANELLTLYRQNFKLSAKAEKMAQEKGWI